MTKGTLATNLSQAYLNIEIRKENIIAEIKNCLSIEEIQIDLHNYKCNGVIFKNCEFNNPFHVLNTNIKAGIHFIDCKFNSIVELSGLETDNMLRIDSDSLSLKFEKVTFQHNLFIKNCKLNRGIKFLNSELQLVHFEIVNCLTGDIAFETSKIHESLVLWSCSASLGFGFANKSESFGRLQFQNCDFPSFSFHESTLHKDLMVSKGNVLQMNFVSTTVNEEVVLNHVNIEDSIFLKNSTFIEKFSIELNSKDKVAKHGKVSINSSTFVQSFNIFHEQNEPLNAAELEVISNDPNTGEINITNLNFEKISISGINKYSIHLKDIQVNRFSMNNLFNSSVIWINNLKGIPEKQSEFCIHNSFINDTIFSNMNFDSFSEVKIQDSNLSKIKANNVKWFDYKDINSEFETPLEKNNCKFVRWLRNLKYWFYNVNDEEDFLKHLQNKKEVFKQLKHAMITDGNVIQSLVFKQYEMKAYSKILQLSKKIWNPDRIILAWSNSNNHGQNWIKPIIILLATTSFIFYPVMFVIASPVLNCSPSLDFDEICNTFSLFMKNAWIIPKMLNPTYSISASFDHVSETSTCLQWLEVLYKVVYAFLVFQIVTAFRKFVK